MLSRMLRRSLYVLVVLTGLALPLTPASAFSLPTGAPSHRSSKSPGSSVWAWVLHHVQVIWEKNGMAIDPNGQPSAAPSQPDPHS